jgi:chorismate mutase
MLSFSHLPRNEGVDKKILNSNTYKLMYNVICKINFYWINMDEIRKKINEIDIQIISLMGKRMKLAKKIGKLKKKAGLPIWDKKREDKLRKIYSAKGKKDGLTGGFINQLFDVIFKESQRIQKD